MSRDQLEPSRDDAELRALFRARVSRFAAPIPSFEAIVARPRRQARPRRVPAPWRLAAAAAVVALAALVLRSVLPHAPALGDDAVALPVIRMPSDALLAAAPVPRVDDAWSSLPTAVLAGAPLDARRSATR